MITVSSGTLHWSSSLNADAASQSSRISALPRIDDLVIVI